MTRTRTARLLGALALAAWLAAPAPAQEQTVASESANNETAELRTEVSTLRAELSELRNQMHGSVSGGYEGGCGCGCDAPCDTCCSCCDCCPSCGWYGGAELIFFQAHSSDALRAFVTFNNADNNTLQNFEFDHEISPRFWLGYVGCDGFGYRARYWHYDDDATRAATDNNANPNFVGRDLGESSGEIFIDIETATGQTLVVHTDFRLETWDWEATQRIDCCPLSVTFAGGLRYVNTRSDLAAVILNANGAASGEAEFVHFDYNGIGPTLAVDARRQVCGNLSLLAGTRHSVVFGSTRVTALELDTGGVFEQTFSTQREDGLYIAEMLLGLEWSQDMGGNRLFARATYEGQYWANVGLASKTGENFSEGSHLFLEGFGFGVGLAR